jgi:hypothetical protein
MRRIVLAVLLFAAGANQNSSSVSKAAAGSAVQAADAFLQGVKTIELPDGKKLISETSWPIRKRVPVTLPVFNHYTVVGGQAFDTDVPSIRGYKRLVDIDARSEAGVTLTKRYMLFLYQDRATQHWKVISFAESQDTDFAVDYFRNKVDPNNENPGYWHFILGVALIDAGKLHEARETFKSALSLAEQEDPTKILSVPTIEVRDYLSALHSIIGE